MATVWTGLTTTPASFAPASNGRVYVVDGNARGVVVVGGTTAYPIGITAPSQVSVTHSSSPQYYFVSSVQVIDGGENYGTPPAVSVPGVSGGQAGLLADRVVSVTFTTSAKTHTKAPGVSFTGGQATSASATALMQGRVSSVRVNPFSIWYSTPPAVTFSAAANVTAVREAQGRAVLTFASAAASSGKVAAVVITDPGVYTWEGASVSDRPITATIAAGTGGTPSAVVEASAAVLTVSAQTTGSGYSRAPSVTITPDGPLKKGKGAVVLASLDGTDGVSSYFVAGGGAAYDGAVSVDLASDKAKAVAVMQPRISGKYLLGVRFIDSYGDNGNFCELIELDCGDRSSTIQWAIDGMDDTDGSPNRVTHVELWRTTSNQAITLYRVAKIPISSFPSLPSGIFADDLTDSELADEERATTLSGHQSVYAALPILTPDGQPNAFRFGVPPANMSVVTLFADRAWYAVDSTGTEPNAIYFSGQDEYESVPEENQLVIQNEGRDSEQITGLMPMDGVLYVGQRGRLVRLTVGADPLTTSSATPVAQRGMLSDRCWDQMDGIAYIADSAGVYAFSGSQIDPISDPISTMWTDGTVPFTDTRYNFVRTNRDERVVRFYYGSTASIRSALCYSTITKAWWKETYAQDASCGVRCLSSGRMTELVGSDNRLLETGSGLTDDGSAVPYSLQTGNFPLNNDPKRGVRLVYTPTASQHDLGVRLHYNNSATPRANAIASDRGTGFTTTTGSTEAVLDLASTRSSLGDASGFAQASLAGRLVDASAGADRHIAIAVAGTQSTSKAVIHSISVEGAG